jgi:phage terminase Nu1 subunit (DNA packaging protein)
MSYKLCDTERLSRKELARLLSVDASTISRNKAAGMPVNTDGKTYSAPACVQWVIARVEQAASADSGESDESRKWLTAFRRERAKTAKIERLEKEKKLIPLSEVMPEWITKAYIYRNSLLAFSSRLPPLLTGKNQLEIRKVLHSESCLLLAGLTKDRKYCSESALPADYKDLWNLEIVRKKTPAKRRKKNGKK